MVPPEPVDPNEERPPASAGGRRRQVLLEPSTWTVALLLLFGGGLLAAVLLWPAALFRFSDQAYARGVITFIISLSTIGIAFVLIYQAFFSLESSDDRFRRAREVFTGLMGVLGTIVGFYFGSAAAPPERLTIAEIRFSGMQLTTYVTGGSPPYRYAVTVGADTVAHGESSDGWVAEALTTAPKTGETIEVNVTDSQGKHASRRFTVPGATTPSRTSPARPDTTGPPPHQ